MVRVRLVRNETVGGVPTGAWGSFTRTGVRLVTQVFTKKFEEARMTRFGYKACKFAALLVKAWAAKSVRLEVKASVGTSLVTKVAEPVPALSKFTLEASYT